MTDEQVRLPNRFYGIFLAMVSAKQRSSLMLDGYIKEPIDYKKRTTINNQ